MRKLYNTIQKAAVKLGSVGGPVIQANGRLNFEDDLRSGGLLYCVSQRPTIEGKKNYS